MDSFTHILSAAILTEPLPVPRVAEGVVYARWRERTAIVLGALLPDVDGMLGWIDLALYNRYHRLVTHSVFGIVVLAFLSAWIARVWPHGWTTPRLRRRFEGRTIVDPSFRRLLGFASVSVICHVATDWVAKWGIWPLWPFSSEDLSLGRVNSLDSVLLSMTVAAWAVQHLFLTHRKRAAAWSVAALWAVSFAAYVYLRPFWGEPAYI